MVYIIVSLICIAIGVALIFRRTKLLTQVTDISIAGMDSIEDIIEQLKFVSEEIEKPNALKRIVEFNGTISDESFITSELSQKSCVYYNVKVEERYEETYYIQNKNRRERHTRTGTKTIRNEIYWNNFYVIKDNLKIKVDPSNCREIDTTLAFSRYEPYKKSSGRDYRILGHQYTETLLPIGSKVYIVGEISYDGEDFLIKKPDDTSSPFIISMKSKEEILQKKKSSADLTLIGAILLFIASVIFFIVGIIHLGKMH
ncbi:MAG: E3 ubiquitin ligase family protein [Candidatus Kapabacteria bacterium]|nr:E3 ubiquitin ligase family protein [Candidatus Kapabacteria bacterium]